MALEQIEESFDLLAALRDSLNYYVSYLETRIEELKKSIDGLSETSEQVTQMRELREQTQQELDSLRAQSIEVEKGLEAMLPNLSLIKKVETIETEIREREAKLRKQEEEVKQKTKTAEGMPDDELLSGEAARAAALFRGEKISEKYIIERLVEDRAWYRERLEAAKVDTAEARKQVEAVESQVRRLKEAILEKEGALANMDNFLQKHEAEVGRLGELRSALRRYEDDYQNVSQVIKIVSEVSIDDRPRTIPTGEQAGSRQ